MTQFGMDERSGDIPPSQRKYCSGCGKVLHKDAVQCPSCGAPQADVGGRKSRLAAILFAIFLGSFGIHKFYLGQVGMGVLYLLFCWTFIPGLVALIEAILLIVMSDQKFHQKYG